MRKASELAADLAAESMTEAEKRKAAEAARREEVRKWERSAIEDARKLLLDGSPLDQLIQQWKHTGAITFGGIGGPTVGHKPDEKTLYGVYEHVLGISWHLKLSHPATKILLKGLKKAGYKTETWESTSEDLGGIASDGGQGMEPQGTYTTYYHLKISWPCK